MCEANATNPVGAVDGASRFFREDTKCCTYQPRLPNYLVGALLADDRAEVAEGRRRIEARIDSGLGVTPQWLKPPASYSFLYDHARGAFGKAAALRCPYYGEPDGGCTIWPWREAVCSTFFWRYVAGADGRTFWMTAKGYLSLVEVTLSRYAVFSLHPDAILSVRQGADAPVEALGADELDLRPPSDRARRELWGDWTGREKEFYLAANESVRSLSAGDLDRMLGLDGRILLTLLERRRAAACERKLPRLVKLNPATTVQWLPDGSVALGAYSENDALALPGEAFALLREFRGTEPVEDVRRRLRDEHFADLDDDVLLVLYQHRVLTDP